MSKAALISIRPKWCEKIASGEKTIEVRKTRPKMNTPFKCYIYCTLQGCNEFFRVDLGRDVAKWNRGKWADRKGKVVGEFTCDRIDWITHIGYTGIPNLVETRICDAATMRTSPVGGLLNAACLTPKMLNDYLAWGDGYGWHISDLRIYDAPRELSEFRRACPNSWYCESCAMYWENNGTCGNESLQLKRAPQSWCYVEEVRA
jgi:predicted transcriptional regulator